MEQQNDEYIDPITGEIIPVDETIKVEHLPNIGNWLRGNDKRQRHLASPEKDCLCDECNLSRMAQKYVELVGIKIAKLAEQRVKLLDKAEQLMIRTGEDKIVYPGCGRFRNRKLPDKLSTVKYVELTYDEQFNLAKRHPALFEIEQKIKLDSNKIKQYIKDGNGIDNFDIEVGGTKFEFKED